MARGVPCLPCWQCMFAFLVFCVFVCLCGWMLLSCVSGRVLCTVAQVVRTAFLLGLVQHSVCVSGDTHWVVCMCTWAFTCLCVGCKCSWVCLLWPVVGVFTLRLLRDVQLSLATSEPQFPHLLHGDNSNTRLVELL